jgi:hypothetical protein
MFPCIRVFCRLRSTVWRISSFFIPSSAPHFPRPPNPCLQSSHPAADTLPGVAARWDRRGVWGRDARPHAPGLRKMVSLRRHGEAMGCRTSPVVSCPRRRAGCACAARKGAGTGGCVGIVRRTGTRWKVKTFRRNRQSVRSRCQNGALPSGNRRTTSAITAFAEGPESRAKTAERGAERCHIQYIKRGSFQRPVRNAL